MRGSRGRSRHPDPKAARACDVHQQHDGCKQDRITTTSLYHILRVKDNCGRTGGWAKHRYRVRHFTLEGVVSAFEAIRASGAYQEAVVLGSQTCIKTQSH